MQSLPNLLNTVRNKKLKKMQPKYIYVGTDKKIISNICPMLHAKIILKIYNLCMYVVNK